MPSLRYEWSFGIGTPLPLLRGILLRDRLAARHLGCIVSEAP